MIQPDQFAGQSKGDGGSILQHLNRVIVMRRRLHPTTQSHFQGRGVSTFSLKPRQLLLYLCSHACLVRIFCGRLCPVADAIQAQPFQRCACRHWRIDLTLGPHVEPLKESLQKSELSAACLKFDSGHSFAIWANEIVFHDRLSRLGSTKRRL